MSNRQNHLNRLLTQNSKISLKRGLRVLDPPASLSTTNIPTRLLNLVKSKSTQVRLNSQFPMVKTLSSLARVFTS